MTLLEVESYIRHSILCSVLTTDAKSLSSALVVKQKYLRVYAYFIHKDFLNAKGNDTLCNYSTNEKKNTELVLLVS